MTEPFLPPGEYDVELTRAVDIGSRLILDFRVMYGTWRGTKVTHHVKKPFKARRKTKVRVTRFTQTIDKRKMVRYPMNRDLMKYHSDRFAMSGAFAILYRCAPSPKEAAKVRRIQKHWMDVHKRAYYLKRYGNLIKYEEVDPT